MYLLSFISFQSVLSLIISVFGKNAVLFWFVLLHVFCLSLYFEKQTKEIEPIAILDQAIPTRDQILVCTLQKRKCMHNNIFRVIFGRFPLTEAIFK